MNAPKNLFYDYQWNWLADPAPFKIGLWARQTGKDYTCAAEAVLDCARIPHNHWLIVACGERQAIESLQHAKSWVERLCPSEAHHQKSEILFANGSRITALPARPETIRGYSANLILTEFAFHDHPDDIWRAVFPILTNPLKAGPRKLRIISTPNGHANKFAQLWNSPSAAPAAGATVPVTADSAFPLGVPPLGGQSTTPFSRHQVTIHAAVASGLPVDLPLLRRGLTDSEAWAQEYECEFLDQSTVLLPYDLIATCESDLATETSSPNLLSTLTGELFLGIDFGRKHDLTVAWILERVSNPAPALHPVLAPAACFITREVLVLEKASTPQQLEALIPRIHRVRRVCVDYTGPGIGLGDILVQQFGEYIPSRDSRPVSGHSGRVELCQFSQPLKNELFTHLRSAFERRLLAIPSSSLIREDLHSIYRILSANGQVTYRANRSPDGHSDRCTALALALRAAESAPPVACPSIVGAGHRHLSSRRFR